MKKEKEIKKIAEQIAKEYKPEKIILFGSYAWGKPGPDSDVDLLVVKKTDNTREMARKIGRLLFPRPFPIDLIVYTPEQARKRRDAGDFFIGDIFAKGKTFYIETRYPGDYNEFTLKEAKEAKEAADKIKTFILNKISKV